jgi:hypothetical protein
MVSVYFERQAFCSIFWIENRYLSANTSLFSLRDGRIRRKTG